MGGEDGRQTNRTVSIQHEHGKIREEGGRKEGKRAKLTIYVSVYTHAN